MTAVIGVEHEGKVYIGGDSCASDDDSYSAVAPGKVFGKAGMVFGFAGSFRIGQVIRYQFDPPKKPILSYDTTTYLVKYLIPALVACLELADIEPDADGDVLGHSELLIGIDGKLFMVQPDLSVLRPLKGVAAIGSGGHVALGAALAMKRTEPVKRINKALKVAESYVPSVCGPFEVWYI